MWTRHIESLEKAREWLKGMFVLLGFPTSVPDLHHPQGLGKNGKALEKAKVSPELRSAGPDSCSNLMDKVFGRTLAR